MCQLTRALLLLVLCASSAVAQPAPTPGDLVINEVLFAPTPTAAEFIEVYNTTDQTLSLDGLQYADGNRDFDALAPAGTALPPGAYLLIARDTTAFAARFPQAPAALEAPDWEGLNNGGDRVLLRRGSTMIDSLVYDGDAAPDNVSLERIDPRGPSTSENVAASTDPQGGTPGVQNSVYAVDTTPPQLRTVRWARDGRTLHAAFSEALAPAAVTPAAFALDGPAPPAITEAALVAPDTVRLRLGAALSDGRYTLVATNMADRRGNVQPRTTASFTYFQADRPAPGDLVINELMIDPNGSGEYVELYNRSNKTIDVRQLRWRDERSAPQRLTATRRPLRPGGYLVLVEAPAAFAASFPNANADTLTLPNWPALNNGGDIPAVLFETTVLDAVPYASSWGGGDGTALARVDPRGPSDAPATFAASTDPQGGTPGARNSVYAPDERAPRLVFAEAQAADTLRLWFSEAIDAATLSAGDVRWGEAAARSVTTAADATTAVAVFDDAPAGRVATVRTFADRTGNEQSATRHVVAFRADSSHVALTEIMYAPRTDAFDDRPNQPEYIEVQNLSNRPRTLRGWFLTDTPDETGAADTLRLGDRLQAVPPGGFAVAYNRVDAAPPSDTTAGLATAFPGLSFAADSVALLPAQAASLGLLNSGEQIVVHRADGRVVARIAYRPDWHAEALETPRGVALERISATGPAQSADNWSSSTAAAGGTPGHTNSLSLPPRTARPTAATLSIAPSPFSIERDGATRLRYTLPRAPQLIRVRIFDNRGRQVRTLTAARLAGPTGELLWDGRDDNGHRLPVGIYVVLFEAVDARGGTVAREKVPVVLARPL
ncbi:lamin tail domain-containing protein [Salisaeta longa]|uniref:lamin tail domain-containing protein n=1 Tax=Salisaeta longa TaxID=503170 RepID=UPI0003B7A7BA|nr:lamin tail domain-containing protein [Salisaeta longa]